MSLFGLGCALVGGLALTVVPQLAGPSRETLFDDGWKFFRGDTPVSFTIPSPHPHHAVVGWLVMLRP